jgi:membrane protease YdiL (CAAX protease family)
MAEALTRVLRRPAFLVPLLVANQVVFGIVTTCAAFLSPVPARRRLGLVPSSLSLTGYVVTAAGAVAIGYGFEALISLLHVKANENLKLISDLIEHLSLPQILLAVFIIGVLPGVFEELLFRGYIQTRLEEAWGRWSGILIAAPLFGIMHMNSMQAPFAYMFGIYLGYVSSKTGSIRPTMFCHMVNNGLQVLLAWLVQQMLAHHPEISRAEQPSSLAAVVMLGVCCLVVTMSVLYVRFVVQPPRPAAIAA